MPGNNSQKSDATYEPSSQEHSSQNLSSQELGPEGEY